MLGLRGGRSEAAAPEKGRAEAVADALEPVVHGMLRGRPGVKVRAWDGSTLGANDAAVTIVVNSPVAIRRLLWSPGELGLARAYIAGEIDSENDMFSVLALRDLLGDRDQHVEVRIPRLALLRAARRIGAIGPPPPPPPEEVRQRGQRHSRARDAAAVSHHYDLSNDFYRIVLGPSMTYSCAVWSGPECTLEAAQAAKHELVCRKLALRPDMHLLDIGCGWGSMLIHAATHHGISGVGVTLSRAQAELAKRRVELAGLADRVEIRLQDYRDIGDGPYDAISSIGMFEHVGLSQLEVYFNTCFALLAPGGRFLNHAIARVPSFGRGAPLGRFYDRYVFPDAELHEVGVVVSAVQRAGFEALHMEVFGEHYARTLRSWVANLEASWGAATGEVGERRARIWRLYMAAGALAFEGGRAQVAQVLAVRRRRDG